VADALKNRGWGKVDRDSIQVQDYSGGGGSKTYKVWATGVDVTPTHVALHSRADVVKEEQMSEERTEAAALLFGDHGLAPRRLVQGVDWYVEPWLGYGQPTIRTCADMQVLGREVAKIHQLPTEWYDPFRVGLKREFSCLADIPDDSHAWWYACRMKACIDPDSHPDWAPKYLQPLFTPLTEAGGKIVTCHGDLHAENYISMLEDCSVQDGKLLFSDLEMAHVSAACSDLAYVVYHGEDRNNRQPYQDDNDTMRRAFLKSYLEAMGAPSTKQDIDALLIDVTLAACYHHFGPVGICSEWYRDLEALANFKQHAAELIGSEAEQATFHQVGPEAWLAGIGCDQVCKEHFFGYFQLFDRIVNGHSTQPFYDSCNGNK